MENNSDNLVKVGMIQGRLSPMLNNRIQQFPWGTWQNELSVASKNNIKLLEWTIDSFNFFKNPLVDINQWNEIKINTSQNNVLIPSVTCDYFMENPPWKSIPSVIKERLILIISGMKNINSEILVIPLVDNSSLLDSNCVETVTKFFNDFIPELTGSKIRIAFESDLNPEKFLAFIDRFDSKYFGINYDIGNSASLDFDSAEEFSVYGPRIINVHVKDRKLNGATVPLGEGNANFLKVFQLLQKNNYQGNLILQTARSIAGKDVEVLIEYKRLVEEWWEEAKID
jgi:L-ribulose-5-phosphate 3-epimerase